MICCCTSTSAQMYSIGGTNTVPAVAATADKTDMTAETTAAVASANLSQARSFLAAAANPSVAGYWAGGNSNTTTGVVITADKLVFATDTTSGTPSANISLAREQLAGLSERSSQAYFAGGISFAPGTTFLTTIDKLTFSGDSTGAISGVLSLARTFLSGMSEGTSKGYWDGGVSSGSINNSKVADKIVFSSDTISAVTTANLSQARSRMASGSDGSTKGYWAGGTTGAGVATTDKLTFSTDTTSNLAGTSFNMNAGASSSNGTKLIGLGGSAGTGGIKIDFATDTSTTLGAPAALSVSRTQLAGASTSAL